MKNKLDIVYEDNHFLIVNKPTGLLVQGDKTGDKTLVDEAKQYIKEKYKKPGDVFLGVVHRLDRPVSGLVILARTSKGLERMNKLFKDREITKTYWALVTKKPPQVEDELVHWLKKNEKTNRTTATNKKSGGGLKAELSYRLAGRIGSFYKLEVTPKTGRPHQIRVQLAKIGCPIVGDLKYGFDKPNLDKSIHLHAHKLTFTHPVKGDSISVTAKTPKDQTWSLFN